MRKGEVWLIELFETVGHEQEGTRPAVILADTPTDVCIVIPLTSNIKALKFPYTFEIEPSYSNGLSNNSIALIFQIRAIDKSRLLKRLGILEKEIFKELQKLTQKLLI